jgi:hypothetical protein
VAVVLREHRDQGHFRLGIHLISLSAVMLDRSTCVSGHVETTILSRKDQTPGASLRARIGIGVSIHQQQRRRRLTNMLTKHIVKQTYHYSLIWFGLVWFGLVWWAM